MNIDKIKQPYIIAKNITIYFKKISPNLDITTDKYNECWNFKYYSYSKNFSLPDYHKVNDIHEQADILCNAINKYLDDVEEKQIMKELILNFTVDTNRNFLDEYLLNNIIEKYLNDKLLEKYKHYEIKEKEVEKNETAKLYKIEVTSNNKLSYEYFLITNVFCINITLNSYCNPTMNKIISKWLLSCSYTKELSEETLYLGITKEELDTAFEIDKIIKNEEIEYKDCISENNQEKLKELSTLLNKSSIGINIMLLGSHTLEKNCLLENITKLIKAKNKLNEQFNQYEIDLKKDINSLEDLKITIKNKIMLSNLVIINNFDYANELDNETQNLLIKTITSIDNPIDIIISGEEKKTLEFMKKYSEITEKNSIMFKCADYSIDKLYQILISKINANNYKIAFTPKEAKDMIKELSKQSVLKNEEFINNIYTKMTNYALNNNLYELDISSFPKIENKDLNYYTDKLNNLIGLNEVKKQVNRLISFWKFKNKVKNLSLNSELDNEYYFNMFLTGNPGTGKTTVAKILGKILYCLDYINEDKFIEITPNDLTGEYMGQTKTKTKEILNQAKGGILFIDEAYLFSNASKSDSGDYFKEAIVELIKYMENPKNVVILAGYSESMKTVLNLNNGIESRVSIFINFDDYNIDELIEILILKLDKQNIKIEESALNKVKEILKTEIKEKNFGNARYIEKLIIKILMKHAENIENNKDKDLMTITEEDIDKKEIINNKINNTNSFGFIKENGDV